MKIGKLVFLAALSAQSISSSPVWAAENGSGRDGPVIGYLEAHGVNPNPPFSNGDRRLCMSRDGRYVYVRKHALEICEFNDRTTLVFQRNAKSGRLSLTGELAAPSIATMALSRDDTFLYGRREGQLGVFLRLAESGELRLRHVLVGDDADVVPDSVISPEKLVLSPDGAHLYSVSRSSSALLVFEREDTTARLVLLQILQDNNVTDQVPGLNRAYAERIPNAVPADGLLRTRGIAISPDGMHVYTTSYAERSVAAYRRTPKTGRLEFLQVIAEPPMISRYGLTFAADIEISDDGRNAYVAAISGSLVVFARDPATGELAWLERFVEGQDSVTGLGYPVCVAVAPNGADVFVASRGGADRGAIARFRRDANTGRLTFLGAFKDGDGDCASLGGCQSLVISPDSQYLYTSSVEHAAGVFSIPDFDGEPAN